MLRFGVSGSGLHQYVIELVVVVHEHIFNVLASLHHIIIAFE